MSAQTTGGHGYAGILSTTGYFQAFLIHGILHSQENSTTAAYIHTNIQSFSLYYLYL